MTKKGEFIVGLKGFVKSPYAWPGGYPVYAVTHDGAALCHVCVKKELRQIVTSIVQNSRDGWKVEALSVNWEDADLDCDHCNTRIESAYGDNHEK